MWDEMERSPALAAPGSNNFGGQIASSTNQTIGDKAGNRQALSEKEEDDLCKKHKPLVLREVARQIGKGIDFEELVAAGQLGLVRALRKFEPDRGATFGAYAKHWVKGEITALFKSNDPLNAGRCQSLTIQHVDEEEGHQRGVVDESVPAIALDLSALSDTDRHIVEARDSGQTLAKVGKQFGISKERVRQREVRARSQIKGSIASQCISDLTKRIDLKTIRHPDTRSRRMIEFGDREPPKHVYCEPKPSRKIVHHRVHAIRLAEQRGCEPLRSTSDNGPVIHAWSGP